MKHAKKMKRTFNTVDDVYDINKMIERLQSYVNKHPAEFVEMMERAADAKDNVDILSLTKEMTREERRTALLEAIGRATPEKYNIKQLDI